MSRWRSLGALLIGATAIGFAPILVRLSEVGPSATAFYRIALALPVYFAWAALVPADSRRPARSSKLLALAGVFFAADLAVWHWSLQFTTVANSTLLTNFAPLFAVIGARVFLHERASGRLLASVMIALGGAALLVVESVHISSRHLLGDALAIVTGGFYAAYLLAARRARQSVSTTRLMTGSGLAACAVLGMVAWLSRDDLLPETPRGWIILACLALVSHVFGQGCIGYALAHLPVALSSVTLFLQPVVAAVLAALILNEKLTMLKWLGGAVVLSGIYLSQASVRRGDFEAAPRRG